MRQFQVLRGRKDSKEGQCWCVHRGGAWGSHQYHDVRPILPKGTYEICSVDTRELFTLGRAGLFHSTANHVQMVCRMSDQLCGSQWGVATVLLLELRENAKCCFSSLRLFDEFFPCCGLVLRRADPNNCSSMLLWPFSQWRVTPGVLAAKEWRLCNFLSNRSEYC